MGVIDEDFINRVPEYKGWLGRKFNLHSDEILLFIEGMEELGEIIKTKFETTNI